ncbi:MAG: ABC transporter substrate-binding protein, partial [Chloroflexota bacterium]|nr:ABC transporter substrate-binding protein [Chloroflexota bacterium]
MMRKSSLGYDTLHSNVSRRGFLALGAGTTAAFLASCGGGQGVGDTGEQSGEEFTGEYTGPAITLAYWNGFTGGDGPAMTRMVKRFNSQAEKITAEANTVDWPTFYQRLPAAANAGKGPDVGAMHLDQLATMAVRNVIVPLDDLAEQINLEENDFTGPVWGPGIYNDQRYGIPLDVHCLAMYWNEDHFEKAGIAKAPTDAASLDETCKKLQEAGFNNPFWMPNQWPAHIMFLSLLWQFGGEPYAEDGSEATFGSEAGVSALTWMREQIDKGYGPATVDADAQYLAFKNGRNSITWDGIWQINDLQAAGMNFGIAPIPTVGDQPASWANSHNFFMTAQAADDQDRANASKAFISWMSDQSAQWAGAGMIPARNSAREEKTFSESPQAALTDFLDNLHFLPPIPGLGDVTVQTIEVAVNEAILGKTSPEDALSQAQSNA